MILGMRHCWTNSRAVMAAMVLVVGCGAAVAAEVPAAGEGTTLKLGTLTIQAGVHPKVYQRALGSFDTIETLVSMVGDGSNQEWAPVCGVLLSNGAGAGGDRIFRLFLKWDDAVPGMLAELMHGKMVMDEDDLAETLEQNRVLRVKLTWRNGMVAISLNGSPAGKVRYDFPIDTMALYSDNAKCVFTAAELSSRGP
jgi:hypothetical protein